MVKVFCGCEVLGLLIYAFKQLFSFLYQRQFQVDPGSVVLILEA